MLGEKETLYQGKSAYYWSEQIKSQNPAATNQANLVLNTEIIPRLTKTLLEDTNDSRLRIALVEKLNDLPGVNIIFRPADFRRGDAAIALGQFGPQAEAAVPSLLQALQGHDSAVRGPAVVSLGHIQAKPEMVVPLLMAYLDDDDLREPALRALGEYGSRAKVVIPKLLLLLKVQNNDLHHAVEEVLKNIDPDVAAQTRAESL
jgi:HEAT repeat protein